LTTSRRLRGSWPPDAFPLAATLLAGIAAIGAAFCAILLFDGIVAIRYSTHGFHLRDLTASQALVAQAIAYLVLGGVILWTLPLLARRSLAELGIRFPTAVELLIGVAGAGGMLVGVLAGTEIVVRVTGHAQTEAAMKLLARVHSPLEISLFVLVTVLLAPLVEELSFRIFVYNAIERYTSVPIAVVLSSAIFGIVHGAGPSVMIPLAIGGCVLAIVYVTTRCYWSCVVTHALFNSVVLVNVLGQMKSGAT